MVTTGEGDHDFPLMLHHLVIGDAVLPQYEGADQTHLVSQVGGAVFLQLWKETIGQRLKPPDMCRWYGVPRDKSVKDVSSVETGWLPKLGCSKV